jgi:hypothetical protein
MSLLLIEPARVLSKEPQMSGHPLGSLAVSIPLI